MPIKFTKNKIFSKRLLMFAIISQLRDGMVENP